MSPIKPGHSLKELRSFPADAAARLSEYSVTTAEEFLGLAGSARKQLAQMLDVDDARLEGMERTAASVVAREVSEAMRRVSRTVLPTGHDAPPNGQSTY